MGVQILKLVPEHIIEGGTTVVTDGFDVSGILNQSESLAGGKREGCYVGS